VSAGTVCLVYVDRQDPSDIGWAYRVIIESDDGRREESGACDGPEHGIRACRESGAPDAPRTLTEWDHEDFAGQESYRWSAFRSIDPRFVGPKLVLVISEVEGLSTWYVADPVTGSIARGSARSLHEVLAQVAATTDLHPDPFVGWETLDHGENWQVRASILAERP
jgi:hypothetical protein